MSLPEFLSHVVVPEAVSAKDPAYYAYFFEVAKRVKEKTDAGK